MNRLVRSIARELPLFALVLGTSALAGTSTYKLDFGTPNSPVASGFQGAELPSLQASTDPSFAVTDEKGAKPIDIQFCGQVGAFSLGDATKPLTTDGIYTFGTTSKEPTNVTFTICGLPPKARVTFYAIKAWNGDARAAFLSLGDSGVLDLAGTPDPEGDPPPLSDFAVIAQNLTVGPTGKLSGTFSNSDGTTTRPEGQWGGLILVVETP